MRDSIHTPGDGRGLRDVWVDGEKINNVFFADTRRGIVDHYLEPIRLHKYAKRILSERLHGHVVVKEMDLT